MGLSYLVCFNRKIQDNLNADTGVVSQFILSARANSPQKNIKAASWQIITLTTGQLLHVAGLALAGGYGVLRKTPGADMAMSAKIYMGMVGGGGLIAIIGGLMFVYICVRNLYFLK
jgi:hypothetical protein